MVAARYDERGAVEVTHDPLRILKHLVGWGRAHAKLVEVTHDPLRILKHEKA